ncbi:MAG: HAD-IB family hydrolase [Bacteroidales bacterium]|nr:HAD-IB family hydrolase [Bacteroidales bacterium]
MKIVVFDFDGTITTKDTFLEFIKFTKGNRRLLFGLFFLSPVLVVYLLKLYPNWKTKQLVFSHFFKGTTLEQFNKWGESFLVKIERMSRLKAIETIKRHQSESDKVVVVSASIENWIKPWAYEMGIDLVLATRLEVNENGKLTGNFLTKNCYGQEKVNRILELFPDRNSYSLTVYGDSRGDKELIEYADKGWYNLFK